MPTILREQLPMEGVHISRLLRKKGHEFGVEAERVKEQVALHHERLERSQTVLESGERDLEVLGLQALFNRRCRVIEEVKAAGEEHLSHHHQLLGRGTRVDLQKLPRAAEARSKCGTPFRQLLLCCSGKLHVDKQRVQHAELAQESGCLSGRARSLRQHGSDVLLSRGPRTETHSCNKQHQRRKQRRAEMSGHPRVCSVQTRPHLQWAEV